MKTAQRPFIKVNKLKRLSKKKRVMERVIRTHFLRRKWERDKKMHAVLESTVNFRALKITADPKIDVDYVRGMSTVSLYGHDYRNRTEENIAESSVHIRPDVTYRLSKLDINEDEGDCNVSAPQQDVELDVLQKTSRLLINDNNEQNIYDRIKNIVVSEDVNRARQS